MEGPQRPFVISLGVLLLLHTVGVIGFSFEATRGLFQSLTPMNLVITVAMLGWLHTKWSLRFACYSLLIFLAGYGVEVAGVATGQIFGIYEYGGTLGPKLFAVPPVIGLNWLMLVYSSGVITKKIPAHPVVRAAVGATIMTTLDFIIEPVAVVLDFWTWANVDIPLQNFIAWWGIAFVMLLGFHLPKWKIDNPLAGAVLLVQAIFFAALRIILL
ncbi:MAG: carotenoid biosynthesis protein [Bacteroidota bacterium]